MDDKVTLTILGSPVRFTPGASRVEGCRKYRVGDRFPPGPCRKSGLPDGATPVDEADQVSPGRKRTRRADGGAAGGRQLRVQAAQEHVREIVKEVHPARVREQVEAELLRQAELAPEAMLRLNGVTVGTPQSLKDRPGQLPSHLSEATYYPQERVIALNPKVTKNDGRWERNYREGHERGHYSPTGADNFLREITAHQFGEHVGLQSYEKEPTADRNRKLLGKPILDEVFDPLAKVWGVDPIVRDQGDWASEGAVYRWQYDNRDLIRSHISRQAGTGLGDLIGEIWQEYSTRGDQAREYAKVAGRGLRDLAEKRP